uniref:Uncharacterized protein n=1 Tax=Anguilla anguilla TaxID=7936 RepID=A0A0E9W505_ANGAN
MQKASNWKNALEKIEQIQWMCAVDFIHFHFCLSFFKILSSQFCALRYLKHAQVMKPIILAG